MLVAGDYLTKSRRIHGAVDSSVTSEPRLPNVTLRRFSGAWYGAYVTHSNDPKQEHILLTAII